MGQICAVETHRVAIHIEEFQLIGPPFERDILKDIPVVYLKHDDELLTFTTKVPQVIGITCIWHQVRYIELIPDNNNYLEVIVGDNPRFRGFIDDIRNCSGEIMVDIDEWDDKSGENLGNVGVLRVEITQKYRALEPPPQKVTSFKRNNMVADLSVFLYEAKGISNELIRDDPNLKPLSVELVLYTPEEAIRVPSKMEINSIKDKSIDPVWNEGFHWTNLRDEPRFLDVRINHDGDWEDAAVCRVDLHDLNPWEKGEAWQWHPILPADTIGKQRRYKILIIDDTSNGERLYRSIKALQYDPEVIKHGDDALTYLESNDILKSLDMLLVNLRPHYGMDGLTFIKKCKEMIKNLKINNGPLIIAMDTKTRTSNYERDRRTLQALGADDLLYRPVYKEDVRKMINMYLFNIGHLLLDIVVNYKNEGIEQRTNRVNDMMLRTQTKKTWNEDNDFKDSNEIPQMFGIMELRVDDATFLENVKTSYSLIYVITVNDKIVQSRHPKTASSGTLQANETIEWHEDIRMWVDNRHEYVSSAKYTDLTFTISFYAYPPQARTWSAEHLIGMWSSRQYDGNFWNSVWNEYHTFKAPLSIKSDDNRETISKGEVSMFMIIRPAQEVLERHVHRNYLKSCDHTLYVGRGEMDTLIKNTREYINEEEEFEETDLDIHSTKPLDRISHWVKYSAHYTPNGQATFDEHLFSELCKLKDLSKISY